MNMTGSLILTALWLLNCVLIIQSQQRDCSSNPPVLPSTVVDTKSRRIALQGKLYQFNEMNAYIVTQKDAHQSEYTADIDMRLQYISGFDGYNGIGIVSKTNAVLWTTEDYRERAEELVDCHWTIMTPDMTDYVTPEDWLVQEFNYGRVGVDPRFISYAEFQKFADKLVDNSLSMDDIENLVDEIWHQDRPQRANGEIRKVPDEFTGKSWQGKVTDVRALMDANNVGVVVLSDLTDIAWLFNLRGSDTPYNPVFFSYAIITTDSVSLYIDSDRIDPLSSDLQRCSSGGSTSSCVKMVSYEGFSSEFAQLVAADYGLIWFEETSSYSVFDTVSRNNGDYVTKLSPVKLLRVQKNSKEQNIIKTALLQDSLAGCEFLKWLEDMAGNSSQTTITESSAMEKLTQLRRKYGEYIGESLPTVTAFGSNTAIPDYTPVPGNNKQIDTTGLYLFDSGAHYINGATDMSRTIHLGTPTEDEREAYTCVLLGLIELSTAVFPENTYGEDLDILARGQIWKGGADYPQPTGHGFGTFIVHEGPTKIAPSDNRVKEDNIPIQSDMYFSNEPAYYKEGEFGVKLEVIMRAVEANVQSLPRGKQYFTFEVESLMPFDHKLIIENQMNAKQIEWFNRYNGRVMEDLGTEFLRLEENDLHEWLKVKTKPISIEAACPAITNPVSSAPCHEANILYLTLTVLFYLSTRIHIL